MIVEEGKRYITRAGRLTRPMRSEINGPYRFREKGKVSGGYYFKDGSYLGYTESDEDLLYVYDEIVGDVRDWM